MRILLVAALPIFILFPSWKALNSCAQVFRHPSFKHYSPHYVSIGFIRPKNPIEYITKPNIKLENALLWRILFFEIIIQTWLFESFYYLMKFNSGHLYMYREAVTSFAFLLNYNVQEILKYWRTLYMLVPIFERVFSVRNNSVRFIFKILRIGYSHGRNPSPFKMDMKFFFYWCLLFLTSYHFNRQSIEWIIENGTNRKRYGAPVRPRHCPW